MLARSRHRPSPSLFFLGAMLVVAVSAGAQDRTDRIALGVGSFGVLDTPRSAELGMELRFAPRAFGLRPVVGGAINSDRGGYLLAGLRRDFNAGERWIVTPHSGVTLFDEGDGKDLGHVVEFRSGLELAYRLGERSRLGISFYHLSNAGLAQTNPGSESLVVVYSFR